MSNPTELSDLDKLEALARAAGSTTREQIIARDTLQWLMKPATVMALIALARRAKPEAEAPAPSKPTDISTRLREYAANPGYSHNDYADTMRQAAEEIERYYGGMMAWKQTAEKKDRDWQAERTARVDDRCAARAQQAAAPGAEPVEPPRMTTDESRECLVKFMEKHFTDKTYHRYIRGQRGSVNLAGDFAWQMARALRMLEAAPSAPGTPEAPSEFRACCDHLDCTTCAGRGGFYRIASKGGA